MTPSHWCENWQNHRKVNKWNYEVSNSRCTIKNFRQKTLQGVLMKYHRSFPPPQLFHSIHRGIYKTSKQLRGFIEKRRVCIAEIKFRKPSLT